MKRARPLHFLCIICGDRRLRTGPRQVTCSRPACGIERARVWRVNEKKAKARAAR